MLAVLLLCVVPHEFVIREHADRLETNFYFDENGREVFTQIIAWTEYPEGEHVFMWRMARKESPQPLAVQRVGTFFVFTFDDEGKLRQIWSLSHDVTWTQVDVEVADRDLLPVAKRRPLRPLRKAHEPSHSSSVERVPVR